MKTKSSFLLFACTSVMCIVQPQRYLCSMRRFSQGRNTHTWETSEIANTEWARQLKFGFVTTLHLLNHWKSQLLVVTDMAAGCISHIMYLLYGIKHFFKLMLMPCFLWSSDSAWWIFVSKRKLKPFLKIRKWVYLIDRFVQWFINEHIASFKFC